MNIVITGSSAFATSFKLGAGDANALGYITQALNYGLHDDYSNKQGINAALMTLWGEGQWSANPVSVYMSGKLNVDWAYQLNDNSSEWNNKLFNRSDSSLNVDDEYWQLLNEFHVSYTPGNLKFRVGKQVVPWGQLIGLRLMDVINPVDQRRGFSDIEFENTIIPIWLLDSQYVLRTGFGPVQNMVFQFVFNPNADFIYDQGGQYGQTGNENAGLWSPNIRIPIGGPFPHDVLLMGEQHQSLDTPDQWDPDGFEYGVRIEAVMFDMLCTLNGFYGRENHPVWVGSGPPTFSTTYDGRTLLHPTVAGYFARQKFVGMTLGWDVPWLRSSALGGVAPFFRVEAKYQFDSAIMDANQTSIWETDEIQWALNLDWKVKIPFLNDRSFFTIDQTFYERILQDYPHGYDLFANQSAENYTYVVMVRTLYFNEKLGPTVAYIRDITNQSNYLQTTLTYKPGSEWTFVIGAAFLDGNELEKGFGALDEKDNIYCKITYQF